MTTDTVTAIEPRRVMILTEAEQQVLLDALRRSGAGDPDLDPTRQLRALEGRIAYGDEYVDATDELDRVTLRKRRLEEELRRANRRIEDLNDIVVDELIARGERKVTRDATGSTLSIKRQIWAKVVASPEADDDEKAAAKATAGAALQRAGLGHFVRADFNLNTVSAHFREQVNNYLEEQLELPAEQRQPKPVEDFLPDELRGYLELTDKPKISVRAAD